MGDQKLQSRTSAVWGLAARQHGVVARRQLLELGLSKKAIKHRLNRGRLHAIKRGVYAVGRPELTQRARWMAAVLACGPDAVLSDLSAAALWAIVEPPSRRDPIDVTVPLATPRAHSGLRIHRRALDAEHVGTQDAIPVTSPILTLVQIAAQLDRRGLERAVNEADKLNLVDPEALQHSLDRFGGTPGLAGLRVLLEKGRFTLTDSELERRFLPLARRGGLPAPITGRRVEGFKVDFFWPPLGLVVETDGLTYHRTPSEQARDRLRDQRLTAAGLTVLRFTHAQVVYEPGHVVSTLAAVAKRSSEGLGPS